MQQQLVSHVEFWKSRQVILKPAHFIELLSAIYHPCVDLQYLINCVLMLRNNKELGRKKDERFSFNSDAVL